MQAIVTKASVKDAILDSTERLLARFGYRKMTVEDIAVEAGIGKGTIYLHFSSKEELVLSHDPDPLWKVSIHRLRIMKLTFEIRQ